MSSSFNKHTSLLASTASAFVAFLLITEGPLSAHAHMKLSSPPPLRGEGNKFYDWSSYDYSMTTPLNADGSNFACKGYQSDVPSKSSAVDTIKAGQPYTVTFAAGGATHSGGSCQFSMSYDGGKTFGVLHSVIGGCPLANSYTFDVPKNLPAGKNVLLSWTWFNKVGNREMYQNCAAVDVQSSSTGSIKLPAIFQANIFSKACETIEGDEVVFPNPGDRVTYGGKWAGQKPGLAQLQLNGCNEDQKKAKFVTLQSNTAGNGGGDGGSNTPAPELPSEEEPEEEKPVEDKEPEKPSSTSQEAAKPTSTFAPDVPESTMSKVTLRPGRGPATSTKVSSSPPPASSSVTVEIPSDKPSVITSKASLSNGRGNPRTSTKVSSAPIATAPASGPVGGACSGSALNCSEDGGSFSVCGGGVWVSMGLVAAGTICKNGAIGFALPPGGTDESVTCTPASLKCSKDGQSFSACNGTGNGYIDMGLVAPGTICSNGKIGFAKMVKARRHRRMSHA